ncbi:MAG: hypothetical protein ACTHK8_10235 [Ginsengibacter sp.]
MNEQQQSLEELQHIKQMMEKSSRFISLSGLSGISAGAVAIFGALLAAKMISDFRYEVGISYQELVTELVVVAAVVIILALASGFVFTYLRSKRNGVSIWSATTYRLVFNLAIPLVVGAFLLLRLLQLQYVSLIAPGCLLFYGLALVNASKYTLGEVRYLGYCELILAIINLWVPAHGLIFWTIGFGLLHIIYGIIMWRKYERVTF